MASRSVPKIRLVSAAATPDAASSRFPDTGALEISITQARCLVDVLSELCLPGGDIEAGEIALDQIGPEKLWSTLSVLEDILARIDEQFQTLVTQARTERVEVAHV